MVCKCCGAERSLRREKRESFLQRRFFPMFGFYPWECALCRKVRFYRERGEQRPSRTPSGISQ